MKYSLRVVCRTAVRDGFALAGVACVVAEDGAEASAALHGLIERPEMGVLLVEDSLYHALPAEMRDALERRPMPVVVPFPGPDRRLRPSAESGLVELLRRAIGYRVRLR